MSIKVEVDAYLTEKRTAKALRRKQRHWKELLASKRYRERANAVFGRHSKIIRMLSVADPTETEHKRDRRRQGTFALRVPKVFSTIENPTESLAAVSQFANRCRTERVRGVLIDHSNLATYDLAANGLLDVIAVEVKYEARQSGRKIRWRGNYPKDKKIRLFIKALGIIKHLEIAHEYPDADEAAKIDVFDTRNKHYYRELNPKKADFKSRTVAGFVDHINNCLARVKRVLTLDARQKLCDYTGEILDNVEEHAGMVDWTIQGYLDTSVATPICEIAIFNFGRTISDSLSALPRDGYTWRQISRYLELHRQRKWFSPSWSESDLLTLIALQGQVSSKNLKVEDTRGNGTIDLIEFFQKVHAECALSSEIRATMAIISGATHILFDGKYALSAPDRGPRRIAFNSENDLEIPPDRDYVKHLSSVSFPGTIISIRFPLTTASTNAV